MSRETIGLGAVNMDGEPKGSLDPYLNLACEVYERAIKDVKEYAANTMQFADAAIFLLRDPYELLTARMKNEIINIIEEKRAEHPPRGKGGDKVI